MLQGNVKARLGPAPQKRAFVQIGFLNCASQVTYVQSLNAWLVALQNGERHNPTTHRTLQWCQRAVIFTVYVDWPCQ